jgi:hypothetical protein
MEPEGSLSRSCESALDLNLSHMNPVNDHLPLNNNMLRTVTVVQQFMIEFNGAVSEEEKIMAITKIILNLMKQSDH